MTRTVDFCFDYASPFAYLASETLARKLPGARIVYKPIYLRGLESFSKGVPFNQNKLAYLMQDLARCAEHEGVPIRMPSNFPVNGLHGLRGAVWTLERGGFEAYHRAMYRATWAEDRNVADKAVVAELAAEAGLDREAFAAGIESAEVKERLKALTAEAEARGAFGVPTFFVDGAMFWGHDRMDYVARAAGLAARAA